MKYLLIPVAVTLASLYLVIERAIKVAVCFLVFVWNISFNKKYYTFWHGVIFFLPPLYNEVKRFNNVSDFFKEIKTPYKL